MIKQKRFIQDRHQFLSRLLLTFALVVIGMCMVSMYRRTVAWRSRCQRRDGRVEVQELMSRLPRFPDFSGRLWLNGMQVNLTECSTGAVSNRVEVAVLNGWTVQTELSKAMNELSLRNSVVLQRGGTFRFFVPADAGPRGRCLWIMEGNATTASKLSASTPGHAMQDVGGQDLVGVLRPARAVRVFSLVNDHDEGMVTYSLSNDLAMAYYSANLEASGWDKRAALMEGVTWYSKEDTSLYTYSSGQSPHDETIWLTLISAKSDYKK